MSVLPASIESMPPWSIEIRNTQRRKNVRIRSTFNSVFRRTIGREAEFGGKPCEGKRKETVSCVEKECAVDGEWSDWSPWGYCDREEG